MLVLILSLAFVVTGAHVLSDVPHAHDDPGSGYTTIVIEVAFGTEYEEVFLRGGFSNNDNGRCTELKQADLADDPCSLPILTHVQPPVPNPNFADYSTNDQYLDFYGEEQNQGKANGNWALGTPTTRLNATEALPLLYTNDTGVAFARRIPNTFWLVQLELDCSKSNGLFEVEVVVPAEDNPRARSYDTPFLQRSAAGDVPRRFPTRINFPRNFDFSKLPTLDNPGAPFKNLGGVPDLLGHRPHRADTPLIPQWIKPNFTGSAAPRAVGWKANMDTASGMDTRPFPMTPLRVDAQDVPHPHRRPLLRDPRIVQCRGTAAFEPPYTPGVSRDGLRQRHMGLCGHVNIFRHGTDTRYCEVNTIS